jgi:hypothetical protein
MYWLRNFTKTENYQWQEQGVQPVAPFPYLPITDGEWDYLDHVMHYLLNEKELYVPKSREMLTSWLVCGYITWECQFYQATEWLSQSEKDEKAQGLIKYANILYLNQPEWMKQRHPLRRGEEGTKHEIAWANSSRYVALPQGVRQVASYHPKGLFSDEAAHQVAWKEALGVAKQACRQIICVSSAAPSEFGYAVDESLAI